MLALFLAEKVVRQYRGTPFEGDLVSALRKVVELLPDEVQVAPEALEGFLAVELGPAVASPDAEMFRRIVDALMRRRRILMGHSSHTSGQTLNRMVDPYRPNVRRRTLAPEVRQHVEPGSDLFPDALKSYADLSTDYTHQVI